MIEKDFSLLVSLIAIGIAICGALVCLFQGEIGLMQGLPLVIIGLVLFPLVYKSNNEKVSELNENIEKIMFFVKIIIIIISFIYVYKIV